MTAYADFGLATTTNMVFDELFQAVPDEKQRPSRVDSAPYDERPAGMPPAAPISPCYSKSSSASSATNSVTGRFSDIEYKYHIDPRVLGTGHHGSVRECVHRTTGRRYAVKSVRKADPATKPAGLAREIDLLREMKHRGVVELVDVHEDAEYVHIVTDLCEGGELFDRIVARANDEGNPHPCLSEDEAAGIVYQILRAVSYMHERGVVHRDLKPENILFRTKDGDSPVKIIDFGLSRRHRPGDKPMSTLVGTPYYIAPDVLRKNYDRSCDLWSVGVIAYILLCGYPPFNGSDNAAVHAAVTRGRYHFPSAEWAGISREARDFVRGLLQYDPRRRMTAERALDHPWMVQWMASRVNADDATMGNAFPASPERTFIPSTGAEEVGSE